MALQYKYTYRAFSLNILSEFPVTGFEPAAFDMPDVMIHDGEVPETLARVVNKAVLFQSNESEYLLRIDGVAAYYVTNGTDITVQQLGTASEGEVSAFLIGSSFGAMLNQRRMLPLHASTVVFDGVGFMFAGISGSGKSTLATALIIKGATLVADDISVIDFSGKKPAVYPAVPFIKIWKDSLLHLGLPSNELEPVRDELQKYYLPISRFSKQNAGIDHIFVLSSHNKPSIEIRPIQGIDKFRALKKHTYLFRGLPGTGLEKNHFILANQLAGQVPMSLLKRPNGDFDTDSLIGHIDSYLNDKVYD